MQQAIKKLYWKREGVSDYIYSTINMEIRQYKSLNFLQDSHGHKSK